MQINGISMNNTINNKPMINNTVSPVFQNSGAKVSFKGGLPAKAYDKATDGIAFLLGKFANTKFAKDAVAFINGESKSKILRGVGKALNIKQKWFQHAIACEAIYLTSFYMYNTKKSKTIPENQKRPMMVNQALVSTLCTTLGYVVDSKISKAFTGMKNAFLLTNAKPIAENMKNTVKEAVKLAGSDKGAIDAAYKMPLKRLNGIASGISKLKSVLVFGFIYRYFSPVFITPIANRVSEYMDKRSAKNKQPDFQSQSLSKTVAKA